MTAVAAQAYLNTRVSVMAARLFDPAMPAHLATLTLTQLAEQFSLDTLLDERIPAIDRARAIEQALIQTLLGEMRLLTYSMPPEARQLLLDWGSKYGLMNLKTLIRGKLSDIDESQIAASLFHLPERIWPSDQPLLRTENVMELLRVLERGPYRQIAQQARETYEQQRDPFILEASVDRRHYIRLARHANQFPGADQAPLRQLIGTELDRIALLWLLRLRFNYRQAPATSYFLLVPSPRRLNAQTQLQLANLETFEQVLAQLPGPLAELLAGSTSITEVAQRLHHYNNDEFRTVLARSASGVARALAYLLLRESDLRRLLAVIQGRLLGFADDLIAIALGLAPPDAPASDSAAAQP